MGDRLGRCAAMVHRAGHRCPTSTGSSSAARAASAAARPFHVDWARARSSSSARSRRRAGARQAVGAQPRGGALAWRTSRPMGREDVDCDYHEAHEQGAGLDRAGRSPAPWSAPAGDPTGMAVRICACSSGRRWRDRSADGALIKDRGPAAAGGWGCADPAFVPLAWDSKVRPPPCACDAGRMGNQPVAWQMYEARISPPALITARQCLDGGPVEWQPGAEVRIWFEGAPATPPWEPAERIAALEEDSRGAIQREAFRASHDARPCRLLGGGAGG